MYEVKMAKFKTIFIYLTVLFLPVIGLASNVFNPVIFEKHLKLIHTSNESTYMVQLGELFAKVKNEGASIEVIISISRRVGISDSDLIVASVKSFPAEDVVSWMIQSSRDAEEIIKIAVFSDIEPKQIIAGAIAAGITQVDAEVMVAVAMRLKREQGTGDSTDEDGKTGLALTPGEELDNGGAAAGASGDSGVAPPAGAAGGGAAGPAGGAGSVGGTGRGIASPS
jgi:hypothetical protein